MSAATQAKSAGARATIAARLFRTIKPWVRGGSGLGNNRGFDDCFEMGDGDEVVRILGERVRADPALSRAILHHYDTDGTGIVDLVSIAREQT